MLTALSTRLAQQRVPLDVTFETTYGCNLNCVHCFNPTHAATSRELATAEATRLIDQLADAGTLGLALTGGEALTRPDLFDLIAHAKSRGLLVTLFTNATLVTPERADRLAALDLYRADVSLYGATQATYEAVTRVPGSFANFVRGLDLLLERQIPVRLKSIMMTLNAHEWPLMRQFSEDRGLHFEFSATINPKATGDPAPLQYRVPPAQTVVWEQALGLQRRPTSAPQGEIMTAARADACARAGRGSLFTCAACGHSACGLSPYGEMNLCVSYQIPQYDLRQGTVAEGWEALQRVVDEAQPGDNFLCPTCEVEPYCTRNVHHAILEMGNANACVPYYLEQATLRTTSREPFTV